MGRIVKQQKRCGKYAPITPILTTHNDGVVRVFKGVDGSLISGSGKRFASLSRSLYPGGMIDQNMGEGTAEAIRFAIANAKK